MIPRVGKIVAYQLNLGDCDQINARRGMEQLLPSVTPGETFPMVITRVLSPSPIAATPVNGQVLLDGHDSFWAAGRIQGQQPGEWHDPEAEG